MLGWSEPAACLLHYSCRWEMIKPASSTYISTTSALSLKIMWILPKWIIRKGFEITHYPQYDTPTRHPTKKKMICRKQKIKCFWERESYVHNRRKRLNHFYHHHHHNNDHQRYRHHDQVVVWVRWSEGVTWQDRLHLFSHQQFSIFIAMLLKMIIVCWGLGVCVGGGAKCLVQQKNISYQCNDQWW